MFIYLIAGYLITISIISYLIHRYKHKNKIEIEAVVIRSETIPSSDGADGCNATFKYNVDGLEYQTWCRTKEKYEAGSTVRIYINKNDYKEVLQSDFQDSVYYIMFIAIIGIIIIILAYNKMS